MPKRASLPRIDEKIDNLIKVTGSGFKRGEKKFDALFEEMSNHKRDIAINSTNIKNLNKNGKWDKGLSFGIFKSLFNIFKILGKI